ncbi:MAG: hypothetical protein RBT74_15500 [Tenuifilaceae bacterium]|jgi:hypothetical protein|nr:hypothetical protein [Tenuifilaceae bacterium]
MEYKTSFKTFVKEGVEKGFFIGTGNPNSKILLIGKESAIDKSNNDCQNWYFKNAKEWETHIEKSTTECFSYYVDEKNCLRKNWGKNTWSKYQLLSNSIWNKETEKYSIDFLESIFTTEINDSPAKKTSLANKSGIDERKLLFKNSAFIQEFPVIVLACSNYIKNNNELREIDEIFNVTYDGDEKGKYWFNKGNWFFTHHNFENSKLVIHTRQLSADVNNSMLEKMGEVIRQHLIRLENFNARNANKGCS